MMPGGLEATAGLSTVFLVGRYHCTLRFIQGHSLFPANLDLGAGAAREGGCRSDRPARSRRPTPARPRAP